MSILNLFRKNEERFNNKTDIVSSAEYEQCLKRFVGIDSSISLLATNLEILKTDVANLRGRFNQRLKGLKEDEKVEEKKENENFINNRFIGVG